MLIKIGAILPTINDGQLQFIIKKEENTMNTQNATTEMRELIKQVLRRKIEMYIMQANAELMAKLKAWDPEDIRWEEKIDDELNDEKSLTGYIDTCLEYASDRIDFNSLEIMQQTMDLVIPIVSSSLEKIEEEMKEEYRQYLYYQEQFQAEQIEQEKMEEESKEEYSQKEYQEKESETIWVYLNDSYVEMDRSDIHTVIRKDGIQEGKIIDDWYAIIPINGVQAIINKKHIFTSFKECAEYFLELENSKDMKGAKQTGLNYDPDPFIKAQQQCHPSDQVLIEKLFDHYNKSFKNG